MPLSPSAVHDSEQSKTIPVSLDTVFRLSQDKNGQVQIARSKLYEAYLEQELAQKNWIPDLSLGIGYNRHEGGIQDFQGNLVHSSYGSVFSGIELRAKVDWREMVFQRFSAQGKVWRQRGELQRLTTEQLLEASNTYFDLLSGMAGIAISEEVERHLVDLRNMTAKLVALDAALKVEASRIEAAIKAHHLLMVRLHEGARASSSRLKYLLGIPQEAELAPVERKLAIVRLVDAGQHIDSMVHQALTQGPGIHELTGLLGTIERMRCQADSTCKWWWPNLEMRVNEGAFFAGPGSRLAGDNRFDAGIHLRWNLTEAFTAKEKRRQLEANISQVQIAFADLQQKLTMGVYEAREAILSNVEQMKLAQDHIELAEQSLDLSKQRLKENIKGRSPSEVLQAIHSLGMARMEYLQTLRNHDKAQVRLFLLVGNTTETAADTSAVPAPGPRCNANTLLPSVVPTRGLHRRLFGQPDRFGQR